MVHTVMEDASALPTGRESGGAALDGLQLVSRDAGDLATSQKEVTRLTADLTHRIAEAGQMLYVISKAPQRPSSLSSSPPKKDSILDGYLEEVYAARKSVTEATKAFHSQIVNLGKILDDKFLSNMQSAYIEDRPVGGRELDQVIAEHLIHEGEFELGATFMQEAKLEKTDDITAYMGMEEILSAMNRNDLGPVQKWAAGRYFAPRQAHQSDNVTPLLLKLAIFEFNELAHRKGRAAAVVYARSHFAPFHGTHFKEIRDVTSSLMHLKTGMKSDKSWEEVRRPAMLKDLKMEFKMAFCSEMDKSKISHLRRLVAAGTKALPDLVKMEKVKKGTVSSHGPLDTLPIGLDLGPEFAVRSTFNCPVDQTQATKSNPPMCLPCGHLVGKNAISKMTRSGSSRSFKCPYCPVAGLWNECKEVKLTS